MEMVNHQKEMPKSFFTYSKMQAERGSLCELPHHIKLAIFKIPS